MATLNTSFIGIDFPNPFILSSAPTTAKASMVKHAFEHGWGGAVLKTIGLEPTTNPSPRLQIIKSGREKRGMVNIELISDLTVEEWEREIDSIRDIYPEHPVIASIMGGGRPEDWQKIIERLEPSGVNAFEMNVSCPNFAERKGAQLGQDPESLQMAITWVREATSLPVIVKLTPNWRPSIHNQQLIGSVSLGGIVGQGLNQSPCAALQAWHRMLISEFSDVAASLAGKMRPSI